MKRLFTLCGVVTAASGPAFAGYLDSGLEAILDKTPAGESCVYISRVTQRVACGDWNVHFGIEQKEVAGAAGRQPPRLHQSQAF